MVFQINARSVSIVSKLFAIGLLTSSCASLDTVNPETTSQQRQGASMWTVSDADTTLYLFGGQELLPSDLNWRDEVINAAIADAEIFIIESDPRPEAQAQMQQLIPQLGVNRDGRTLRNYLSDEQKVEIGAVTETLGVPLSALDQLRPWLASLQLGILNITRQGYLTRSGVSSVLIEAAQANDKSLRFLEAPGDLLVVMSNLPEKTQVKMLVKSARDVRDKPNEHDILVNDWAKGDDEALALALHGENGAWADRVVYEAMLVQRNEEWTVTIKELLEDEQATIFLMAGVGHFVGDDSLLNMLKRDGYDVVRR